MMRPIRGTSAGLRASKRMMARPFQRLAGLGALLCILFYSPALSAAAEDPSGSARAPVVVDGRVLFSVGPSGSYSASERATQINHRLEEIACGPEPIEVELTESGTMASIRLNGRHLISVTDADVVPGMAPREQAAAWMDAIRQRLIESRDERTGDYLRRALITSAGVTLLAVVLHWLLWWVGRRLPHRLFWRLGLRPSGVKPPWQSALALACLALQAGAWLGAAYIVTDQFPSTRQLRYTFACTVDASLRAPLFSLETRSYSTLDLLWLAGLIVALWISVSLGTRLLSVRVMRATGTNGGALQPASTLVRYLLTFIGLLVILQIGGLDLSSLAIVASVLGVGIGFGLQNIANNFISGLIISFERPVKPGDFVAVGKLTGTVEEVGGRSTKIRTLDRVTIIVPNSRLLENEVVNWSHGDPLARLHIAVGVAYGSDIQRVRSALLSAATAHPSVVADPRPEVHFEGFGDHALNFELLVWSRDPQGQLLLKSDLYYQIETNLRQHDIEVPFPQRTLHIPPAEIDALLAKLQPGSVRAIELYGPNGTKAAPEKSTKAAPVVGRVDDRRRFGLQSLDVDALVRQMRAPGGVSIADRRYRFSMYSKCFVGTEAVEWLMHTHELTREEALRLGQNLVERGIIHHVLDEHPFRDGPFFYRFYADESAAA